MQIGQVDTIMRSIAFASLLLVMCASPQQDGVATQREQDCVLTEQEYEFLGAFNERLFLFEIQDSTAVAPIHPDNLSLIGPQSSLAQDYESKNACSAPLDLSRLGATASESGGRFSRVGFSAGGDSALVQVWLDSRSGKDSYVLVRKGEQWAVAQTATSDEVRIE